MFVRPPADLPAVPTTWASLAGEWLDLRQVTRVSWLPCNQGQSWTALLFREEVELAQINLETESELASLAAALGAGGAVEYEGRVA